MALSKVVAKCACDGCGKKFEEEIDAATKCHTVYDAVFRACEADGFGRHFLCQACKFVVSEKMEDKPVSEIATEEEVKKILDENVEI